MAIEIKIKNTLSNEPLQLAKATPGAAAYDLRAAKDFIVRPGRNIIPTGVAIQMPENIKADVRPRSGFSAKGFEGRNITDTETFRFQCDVQLGTIDSDYRSEIGVIVCNWECEPFICKQGTRIAQLVFSYVPETTLVQVDELDHTGRGGFGSTGTK